MILWMSQPAVVGVPLLLLLTVCRMADAPQCSREIKTFAKPSALEGPVIKKDLNKQRTMVHFFLRSL